MSEAASPPAVVEEPEVMALIRQLEQAGALTPTQLKLTDGKMPYEQYEALGTFLGRVQDGSRWWIGDWLVFGEHVYGEKYAQAASHLGLTPGTLQNYAYVARAVPPQRRRAGLPFSTHREVAALDAAEQKKFLKKAEDEGLTRAKLAAEINPPKNRPNPGVSPEQQLRDIGHAILRDAVQHIDGGWLIPDETMERLRALLGGE